MKNNNLTQHKIGSYLLRKKKHLDYLKRSLTLLLDYKRFPFPGFITMWIPTDNLDCCILFVLNIKIYVDIYLSINNNEFLLLASSDIDNKSCFCYHRLHWLIKLKLNKIRSQIPLHILTELNRIMILTECVLT